ncbi:MAG: 5-formyltetrahydrofolate cyclo-ligase [bacterium]
MNIKTLPLTKSTFRQKGLEAREKLSRSQIEEKNRKITQHLTTLPEIKNSSEIFCYLSSDEKKEAGTNQFISWALEQNKNIYVPRSNWRKKTLTLHKLPAFPPDKKYFDEKYGIPEPKEDYNLQSDLSKLEIVILPGTAGDLKGARYGLKAGFYDRFLERLSKTNKTFIPVLILFEEQIFPQIPREEHDFPVKIIVTEKKIYRI